MKVPCLDCIRREAGCHSKCKEYSTFLKINEKVKAERIKANDLSGYMSTECRKNKFGRRKRLKCKISCD